jgi:hypothetical protein
MRLKTRERRVRPLRLHKRHVAETDDAVSAEQLELTPYLNQAVEGANARQTTVHEPRAHARKPVGVSGVDALPFPRKRDRERRHPNQGG